MRFTENLLGLGYQTPGSESDEATEFIEEATGYTESDLLVVSSDRFTYDDPEFQRAFDGSIAAIEDEDARRPRSCAPARTAAARSRRTARAATAVVAIKGEVADRQDFAKEVQGPIDEAAGDGLRGRPDRQLAGAGGPAPHRGGRLLKAEAVGFPIALFLLLLAFGTVVAAGLPLMMAYGGLIGSIGVVALLMFGIDFNYLRRDVHGHVRARARDRLLAAVRAAVPGGAAQGRHRIARSSSEP